MAHSSRQRHRDREPRRRQVEEDPPVAGRVFRISDAQRQEVATTLGHIDEARRALESQHNPDNRQIIRELKASADHIFDLIDGLEEMDS